MVGQMHPLGTAQRRVVRRRRLSPTSLLLACALILAAGAAIGTGIKMLTADDCYSVTFETRHGDTAVGQRTAFLPCF
ncbi:MAG: hypothetical protein AAGI89_07065 [Pseudomonadota bacterium]